MSAQSRTGAEVFSVSLTSRSFVPSPLSWGIWRVGQDSAMPSTVIRNTPIGLFLETSTNANLLIQLVVFCQPSFEIFSFFFHLPCFCFVPES